MKRGITIGFWLFLVGIFLVSTVMAAGCDLSVTLLNQDPYPAVPGDYVKLVFQIAGVENPECGSVSFELIEKYPISFDPGTVSKQTISAGTFVRDHSSVVLVPYKVRVDPEALDGDNTIEVEFTSKNLGATGTLLKTFTLDVNDVKADFEVFVKDYDYLTNILTLEVLNIAEDDVEALAVEVPQQNELNIKGSTREIVGDLDSSEYTTADFEIALDKEETIQVNLIYTDAIGERRTMSKEVVFNPEYFQDRKADQTSTPWWNYLIVLIVLIGIVWWWRRRKRKQKEKRKY